MSNERDPRNEKPADAEIVRVHPRRKQDPEKYCSHCGIRLERKRFNGRMEDMAVFIRRKYCGMECARYAPHPGPKVTSYSQHRATIYRRNSRHIQKAECSRCGSSDRKLCIHHVNHDWRDNRPENLEVLCFSCHSKHHNPVRRVRPGKAKGEKQGSSKLKTCQVLEIRELAAQGMYQRDIAKRFGVVKSTIGKIARKEAWKHV